MPGHVQPCWHAWPWSALHMDRANSLHKYFPLMYGGRMRNARQLRAHSVLLLAESPKKEYQIVLLADIVRIRI